MVVAVVLVLVPVELPVMAILVAHPDQIEAVVAVAQQLLEDQDLLPVLEVMDTPGHTQVPFTVVVAVVADGLATLLVDLEEPAVVVKEQLIILRQDYPEPTALVAVVVDGELDIPLAQLDIPADQV
jgi:hypothetical protein